jgi:predicted ArsR family transcriptional regulator
VVTLNVLDGKDRALPEHLVSPRPRSRPTVARALEHAALASPTRLQLLEALVDGVEPRHLDDLAEELGLHASTVRGHLSLLEEAGLVERVTVHQGHLGRPQVFHRATAKARSGTIGCLGYRTLAEVLTGYLDRVAEDPTATGERVGRAWAAVLARRTTGRPTACRDRVRHVAETLDDVGFPSEVRCAPSGCVIVHPRCPFAAAVGEHGRLVCSLHLGLVDGLLEAAGAPVISAGLVGDVADRTCAVRLRRRPRSEL